jgi:MFS family permease
VGPSHETLTGGSAPITIADIFFLHERGSIMAWYSAFLAVGVALGLIISGYLTLLYISPFRAPS